MIDSTIFKAYDIRGTYPGQINEAAAERIAGAYAAFVKPKTVALQQPQGDREQSRTVAVGGDVRTSTPALKAAVIKGLTQAGVNVVDIGIGPTEMIYFAVGSLKLDGGIQISASHNPAEYNGLKMVREGVEALSSDTGLKEIQELALSDHILTAEQPGTVTTQDLTADYLAFIHQRFPLADLPALKIVANNNFGLSGPLAKKFLDSFYPGRVEFIELNFQPDGTFPKGRPDPLVPENRAETSQMIRRDEANFGIAWDADGDRCYLADENGEFIEGCHLTALLAEHLLQKHPGDKIIYDPRNIWAVEETVKAAGGTALMNKAGHTFIKNRMKQEDALFAGEMSGHFYFRDFFYADNGLIPFLLFLDILAANPNQKVSAIIEQLRSRYFVSGEINFKVKSVDEAINDVKERFPDGSVDQTDGLSLSFPEWRFNLRPSNTEPLLRLNVEAKDADDCLTKTNLVTEVLSYHKAA